MIRPNLSSAATLHARPPHHKVWEPSQTGSLRHLLPRWPYTPVVHKVPNMCMAPLPLTSVLFLLRFSWMPVMHMTSATTILDINWAIMTEGTESNTSVWAFHFSMTTLAYVVIQQRTKLTLSVLVLTSITPFYRWESGRHKIRLRFLHQVTWVSFREGMVTTEGLDCGSFESIVKDMSGHCQW